VKTRWSAFLGGACVFSAALGEGVRAIPVQEVRRPPLRVIVYDETSDAPRADAGDEDGAGSNATRGLNEADCLFTGRIESRPCADDRARPEVHRPSPPLDPWPE